METHIRELADYKLTRPVGESFSYNNTGYDMLGLIVQTVSNSYTSKSDADANGLAAGHTYFFGSPRVSTDAPYARRKLPSGFLISSAEDVGHFLIAQLNGGQYNGVQVLSPDNMAMMHQPELTVRHGGDNSSYHSNMAFSPMRGWGVAVVVNAFGFPQSAALNEPVNEVMRLASGYEAGQPVDDMAPVFYVLWGIAILSAVLNLFFGWAFWRRMNIGGQPRLVRNLLLPLAINLGLIWFMFLGFPTSMDTDYKGVFVYTPDTSLIFLVSAVVILLAMLLRLGVYLRSLKASTVGKDKIGHR